MGSQIADFDLLKRISEVSGGAFYPASDTSAIPPFPELPERQLTRRSELALFDYPAVLIVFMVAICAEWILRRKYQLL